jgi:hypothetical protein
MQPHNKEKKKKENTHIADKKKKEKKAPDKNELKQARTK